MGRVLIVDDSPVARRMARHAMQKAGHTVVEVDTGQKALDFYGRESVDLVVLDLQMPGLSGIETLKRLKAMDPNVRVVIYTGETGDICEEARALGAIGFMAKSEMNKLAESMEPATSKSMVSLRRGESRKVKLLASGVAEVPVGSQIEVVPLPGALGFGEVVCGRLGDQVTVARYLGTRGDQVEVAAGGRAHLVAPSELLGKVLRAQFEGRDIDPNQLNILQQLMGRLTRFGTGLAL